MEGSALSLSRLWEADFGGSSRCVRPAPLLFTQGCYFKLGSRGGVATRASCSCLSMALLGVRVLHPTHS